LRKTNFQKLNEKLFMILHFRRCLKKNVSLTAAMRQKKTCESNDFDEIKSFTEKIGKAARRNTTNFAAAAFWRDSDSEPYFA